MQRYKKKEIEGVVTRKFMYFLDGNFNEVQDRVLIRHGHVKRMDMHKTDVNKTD